jgi:ribonuclease VapC
VFIDTSVIVAILSKEPDATEFANQIEAAEGLTSALVILESAMILSTKLGLDPVVVETRIQAFLHEARIKLADSDLSAHAFQREAAH